MSLSSQSAPVEVNSSPLRSPRKLRIVTIGAGFGGLMMAYKLQHEQKDWDWVEHKIYEKNIAIGGTWLENNYPGLLNDVPAAIYTFKFEPNPDWSAFYVGAPEILAYMERAVAKWDLAKEVSFNSKVTAASWNETTGKWTLAVEKHGQTTNDVCDILVDASGLLNDWSLPDIPGLKDFQGHLVHSADWDHSYSYARKQVGIIGNGSSGIQLLPPLQKMVGKEGHLTSFIRSPGWVTPPWGGQVVHTNHKNVPYTPEQIKEFHEKPEKHTAHRRYTEGTFSQFYYGFVKDSPAQEKMIQYMNGYMKERLGNRPDLYQKLLPAYPVGCRRLTPGQDYLEALQEPNVTVRVGEIQRITVGGVTTNAEEVKLDALVLCTGYNIKYRPSIPLQGKNIHGVDLSTFNAHPRNYLSIMHAELPNYLVINGPGSPFAHGSLLSAMHWMTDYIGMWIQKVAQEHINSFCVKQDAMEEYTKYTEAFMKRTVWSANCNSWYKGGSASAPNKDVPASLYAGSLLHFKEMLSEVRAEDFDIRYRCGNRYRFLGDGFTQWEYHCEFGKDVTDLAFYLER